MLIVVRGGLRGRDPSRRGLAHRRGRGLIGISHMMLVMDILRILLLLVRGGYIRGC